MIFSAPWVLLALAALPALWWLLRVTPPTARLQSFPAIRLLSGLRGREETAARTPWWLLALRVLAAGLLIVGLAGPVLNPVVGLPTAGPVLLVIDNGWTAAPGWTAQIAAAQGVLDRADRAGQRAALLTTAASGQNLPPALSPTVPAAELHARLAAMAPLAWPNDLAAAAAAICPAAGCSRFGAVVLVTAGVGSAADAAFGRALAAAGPVTEITPTPPQARLLLRPRSEGDRLVARVAILPQPVATEAAVLAQSGDGRTLARTTVTIPAGATTAEAAFVLPAELRNRLTQLTLYGPASAGSVYLLDDAFRRRPVGLVADGAGADAPLTGTLFYLDRALAPFSELRRGSVTSLLSRDIAVIVVADRRLEPAEAVALTAWVEHGGLLLRFAGPASAAPVDAPADATPDPLMPERLLTEDRQLGGALSWSQPAKLAPFAATSPFAGLPIPDEVQVTRQVLAEPSAQLNEHSWARLADGTPLVTEAARGAGRVVLFHVTANADWSNLPLSGLFPDMLHRLVDLSAGVAGAPEAGPLSPAQTLDGFGALTPPPPAAMAVAGDAMAATAAGPTHPPGLYGPGTGQRALNLANALPTLRPMPDVPGAAVQSLGTAGPERALAPWLLAAGLILLAADMLIALRLRGLLRPALAACLLLLAGPARAQTGDASWQAALATRVAFVQSGDPAVDDTTRLGLTRLAEYVNARTAARLAAPAAVVPGRDDLSYYPLLYWPVMGPLPDGAAAAMNAFMRDGGIIVIDSRGNADGLKAAAQGLAIPPLTPLGTDHVLSRSFYLLSDYPGVTNAAPVWVQRDQDRSNDDVSPVVLGDNDWAAAWAAALAAPADPSAARQRTLAFRFGVNLVIYALTGNYKGDQVHVPHILERLGQ